MTNAFMLEPAYRELFDICETQARFINSFNPRTNQHEPDGNLFNAMLNIDQTFLLLETTESWIKYLIQNEGVDSNVLQLKYAAEKELSAK